ncbi:MAG: hypothetical protein HYX94_12870 [Chloroflexi bacterium]|nr:hypothetical protein [Chloroflexota bacterium]
MTEWFLSLAEATRKAKGLPDLPLVVVPHPFDTIPEAAVLAAADRLFNEVVSALTYVI